MRFVLLFIVSLLSFSSMAWIDVAITSGDFLMWARLEAQDNVITHGTVVASEQENCTGTYTLDPYNGLLSLSFIEKESVTPAQCKALSMSLQMGPGGFSYLIDGHRVEAVMRATLYSNDPRPARIVPLQLF